MIQSGRLQTPDNGILLYLFVQFYIPFDHPSSLPPPQRITHCSSSSHLSGTAGRSALDSRLGVGLGQALDFALLAVLYPNR